MLWFELIYKLLNSENIFEITNKKNIFFILQFQRR